MKRAGIIFLTLIMVLGMAACGGRADGAEKESGDLSSLLENLLSTNGTTEEMPDNEITVPEPPMAKEYLSGLWHDYDCTQTSVDVSGLQATYAISAQQDNRLVDCEGSYYLILEYDIATGKWHKLDSDWLDREYTFDTEGFAERNVWFVCPKPGSDGLYLYFENVTAQGCDIRWESMDEDLTVNGELSGEAYCTFRMGALNGNANYPCWVLDDLEIEFNWNYYGGKYQTCIYYVQIQCDKINAPLDDPFGHTTGDAAVSWVNQ